MNKQRRAYHHGNLPSTMVAAGLALVEAAGVEALSLRKLAARIRVSAAAVYRHFADKDALLAAIAAEGFAMLNDKFDATAPTSEVHDPLSRLQALGSAYVNLALGHPGLFRLMFGSRQRSGVRDARLDEQARRAYRTLEATVAAWSMVHGYAMLRLEDQLAGFPPDSLPDTPAILASLIPQA